MEQYDKGARRKIGFPTSLLDRANPETRNRIFNEIQGGRDDEKFYEVHKPSVLHTDVARDAWKAQRPLDVITNVHRDKDGMRGPGQELGQPQYKEFTSMIRQALTIDDRERPHARDLRSLLYFNMPTDADFAEQDPWQDEDTDDEYQNEVTE